MQVVEKVGEDISDGLFQIGDSVVGLLPLDTKFGGYSDYCLAEAHYFGLLNPLNIFTI